jgi:hypothetical protein
MLMKESGCSTLERAQEDAAIAPYKNSTIVTGKQSSEN